MEEACPQCRGAGVIPIKDGPLTSFMDELGVFCRCSAGAARWRAVLEAIGKNDPAAAKRSGIAPKIALESSRGRVL